MKVMIGPPPLMKLEGDHLKLLRQAGFDPIFPDKPKQMLEEDILRQMKDIKASLAGSEPYSRRVLEQLPRLKIIARCGVGWDAVDTDAATERGIVVTIAAGTNQDAVAEHTFMLMLALAKKLIVQHTRLQKGEWPRNANLPLRGSTLGLIGLGRIGKAVALRGKAFGMKVIAFDPVPDSAFVQAQNIELLSLDEVMQQADWISLHLPAFAQTHHLINRAKLALMKPTAFLINTARGAVVEETALFEALRDKKIAGAGLDVFEKEPPGGENPILHLENVVATAHTAGVDQKSRDDMARAAAQAIVRIAAGEWPTEWIVNPEVKAKFSWN